MDAVHVSLLYGGHIHSSFTLKLSKGSLTQREGCNLFVRQLYRVQNVFSPVPTGLLKETDILLFILLFLVIHFTVLNCKMIEGRITK